MYKSYYLEGIRLYALSNQPYPLHSINCATRISHHLCPVTKQKTVLFLKIWTSIDLHSVCILFHQYHWIPPRRNECANCLAQGNKIVLNCRQPPPRTTQIQFDMPAFESTMNATLAVTDHPSSVNLPLGPLRHVGDGIFLQTKTAQGIAGAFVWMALFLTCQQVSIT